MNSAGKINEWVLDLVFPSRCIGCDRVGEPYVCDHCLVGVPINKNFRCIDCGLKTNLGITCLNCSEGNSVDQLRVVADYDNWLVKKAIQCLKYSFIQELANPLSSLADEYIKWLSGERNYQIFTDDTIITAVPLSRKRNNWRGFNQSELIAKNIADRFLINCDFKLLARTGLVRPQVEIENREKRIRNIQDTISLNDNISVTGHRVIVVDDVSTTGTTLNACARALKGGGAKEVIGLVIARG